MISKEELRLLWPFYLSSGLRVLFSVLVSYWVIYFLSIGFSMFQITSIFAASTIASILTEIPTGAVADIFGRKVSVILSYFFSGILLILVPLWPNYWWILSLYVLIGVSATLKTGAYDAWVVDNLHKERKKKLISNFYANLISIQNAGFVLSPLLAAFLVSKYDMSLLWYIEGVGWIIAGLILFVAVEHFHKHKPELKKALKKSFQLSGKAVKYSKNHPIISKIILASLFITVGAAGAAVLWQPYLKTFDVPLSWFGYVMAVGSLMSIVSPRIAKYLSGKTSKISRYLLYSITFILAVFVASWFIKSMILAGFIVVMLYFSIYLLLPVQKPFMQSFIPSRMRATIGSVESVMENLGAAIALLVIGLAADMFGAKNTMAGMAVFLIPAIFLYMRIGRRGH